MREIVSAVLGDENELSLLENSIFTPADGLLTKRAFAYHIKSENILLVCKDEYKIVGYILLFAPPKKSYARLYSLALLPRFRGMGIADQLVAKAINMIEKKYVRIFLEVRKSNTGAISLYEKFGFTCKREIPAYYSDGENAIKMCRVNST